MVYHGGNKCSHRERVRTDIFTTWIDLNNIVGKPGWEATQTPTTSKCTGCIELVERLLQPLKRSHLVSSHQLCLECLHFLLKGHWVIDLPLVHHRL